MHCEATLHPVGEARTIVVGDDITTEASFIGDLSEVDFIDNTFKNLFKDGERIYNEYQKKIDALNLTEEERKKLITTRETNVRVIGYNSRKFDINLIISNLRICKVENIICSITQYKSIVFSYKEKYPFCLQFLDLQSFLSGGSLDDNVKIFTGENLKEVFPYELLTKENLTETLLKEEPFEKKDFILIFRIQTFLKKSIKNI
jgi:hypothetical protein